MEFHYTGILKKYGHNITNIAHGGCSNLEIFYRTTEQVTQHYNQFDCVIVQWSSLHRLWLYEGANNVDDTTIILPNLCGHISNQKVANSIHKLYVGNYLNSYVELKHWLLLMVSLQKQIKFHKLNYIFSFGFENYLDSLNLFKHKTITDINDIPSSLKNLLDFDNRSDDYILTKLNELISLYSMIDFDKCLLDLDSFYNNIVDMSDDNIHPGKESNERWATAILGRL
jgi:hypothetical protein